MRRGPSSVAQIILDTLDLDAAPTPVVELATSIILAQGWESNDTTARETAESWEAAILTTLRNEVNALLELGRFTRIAFNSSSTYMIEGACYIELSDPQDLREKKSRRLRSYEYYRAFEQLTPSQFEQLCGKVIRLLGVNEPVVTRASADEGIDFYGQLSLESIFFPHDLTPTIQRQLTIWIVGQAKHYKKVQSGTSEVRDLVGAIELGRVGAFGSAKAPFHDLQIRVTDPVFAILITTGQISANAWRLLRRSGVIGVDGEMLAAFLADREAGLQTSTFDPSIFLKWIEEK